MALSTSCTSVKAFTCADNVDCGGDKVCQVGAGFCSVVDGTCTTGYRFDESAGNGLAGQCVDRADEDAGSIDAGAPDAPAPDADPSTFLYVDAINGSDFNTGSAASPYKSITKAIGEVEPGGVIFAAPGVYDAANNETFPIILPEGVALVGDEDNKGEGPTATEIVGDGLIQDTDHAAVVLSEGSQLLGFKISVGTTLSTCGVNSTGVTAQVRDNTFAAGYCGARIEGEGNSLIRGNVFKTWAYGVVAQPFTGQPLIDANLFESPNLPLYMNGSGEGFATIKGNTVDGAGNTNCVAGMSLFQGNHRVEDNVITTQTNFNSGCINVSYGAPVVRNTTCNIPSGPGVVVENDAEPHFGVYDDPGNNVFYSAPGISHRGSGVVWAGGNKWRQYENTPTCGLDIEITSTGRVEFGTQNTPATCP
jgi:hypothetical protein